MQSLLYNLFICLNYILYVYSSHMAAEVGLLDFFTNICTNQTYSLRYCNVYYVASKNCDLLFYFVDFIQIYPLPVFLSFRLSVLL